MLSFPVLLIEPLEFRTRIYLQVLAEIWQLKSSKGQGQVTETSEFNTITWEKNLILILDYVWQVKKGICAERH